MLNDRGRTVIGHNTFQRLSVVVIALFLFFSIVNRSVVFILLPGFVFSVSVVSVALYAESRLFARPREGGGRGNVSKEG